MYMLDVHFFDILPDFFLNIPRGRVKETKDIYVFFNDMHFSIFCLNNFFLVITKC